MLKRTVAILASAAVLALLITPSAQAAGPDKLDGYAAGSNATALAIHLIDQELAFAATTAAISSLGPDDATAGPTAAADGAALLVSGTPVPSGAPSKTPGGEAVNEVCTTTADAADVTDGQAAGVGLSHACVLTSALIDNGAPGSSSESEQLIISLNGFSGPALAPLADALAAALTPLLDAATQTDLCEAGGDLDLPVDVVGTVCEVVNQTTQINIDDLVDELLDRLAGVVDGSVALARITVAPSLSRSSANSVDGVVAQAGSTGVDIELFPGVASSIDELTGLIPDANVDDALLKVSLGNATAKVQRDPVSGKATPDASAAQLVSINLTDTLGILSELVETNVPDLLTTVSEAGSALSCDGGALSDLLCIDLGAVNELDAAELEARGYDFGDGTVGREASAAHAEVLPILGNTVGGAAVLALELSRASAAGNAVPAAVAPPNEVPSTRGPLPKTGGAPSLLLALGLFGAAAAGLSAVRRTRSV